MENIRNKWLITIISVFILAITTSAQEWNAEFNRFCLNTGRVSRENYPNYHPNLGIGFLTEFNPQPLYFGISGEYHTIKERFETFTIDVGYYAPIMADPDMDIFLGIIPLSANLSKFGEVFNSAFLFKYRLFDVFFESKINFWVLAKGKDQPFRTNSYYSLSYRVYKGITIGVLYKPYLDGYHYTALNIGLVW